MNFDEAFAKVVDVEKGYVNHPDDPGGETNLGISKRAYPNEDIKGMTIERAKVLYKRDYWDKCSCDQLPGWLTYNVFDAAVNSGVSASIFWLQRSVGAKPDKIIGAATIACARRADPGTTIARFNAFRLKAITQMPVWKSHGKGLVIRVADNILDTLS